MRTTSRLAVTAALLGGGLLLAGPAAAATPCPYPYDRCPGGGGGRETTTVADSGGGAETLPFTGGEITLMALAGTAALGGGTALVVAGRRRVAD